MRVLSPILSRVIYPFLGSAGYFRHCPGAFISVVTYHGVLPESYHVEDAFLDAPLVTRETFRRQLRLLKSNYDVISPEQFFLWLSKGQELPRRAVLLTCDDGLLNNLTQMLPILREEDLKCLFFITGASVTESTSLLWYVELYLMLMASKVRFLKFSYKSITVDCPISSDRARRSLWLDLLPKLSRLAAPDRRGILDEAPAHLDLQSDWRKRFLEHPVLRQRFAVMRNCELRQLAEADMSIGAHSVDHPILSELPFEMTEAEIVRSRELLQPVGKQVWAFAYPFGDASSAGQREFGLAEKAGFQCAFMNTPGELSANSSRFSLPRVHVSGQMNLREFEAHVTGVHFKLHRRLAS
jgi:peptidoglycan/xylan/chitin deacetylase (PgdA/CDA1 family)